MSLFRFFSKVFKNYDQRDKLITVFGLTLVLLMMIKRLVFPYGLFNFGQSSIYTEGIVSQNGIQTLNPLFVDFNEADREASALVFSGLMKYDPLSGNIIDDMAQLTISEDKTEYTLTLKAGLKWHDGEALTAEDVYFTYHDMIMSFSFPNKILKANFEGVEIDQVDDRTVTFILERPNVFFITNLTIGILPQHILGEVPPEDILLHPFNRLPVGSGPYKLTEPPQAFGDGRMQLNLERNLDYYGAVSEIEFVRLVVYPTMESLLDDHSFVNSVVKVTGAYLPQFQELERFELIPYRLPQYTAVFINMEDDFLNNNRGVRLALQKAIDKEELITRFNDKEAVDTPLMQLNQDDWEYQPSVEEAQGALKDAGFVYPEDDAEKTGVRVDEDGDALSLRLLARLYAEGTDQFEETKKVVTFLQTAWESIGIDIKVELLELDDFRAKIMERDYDLLLVGQSLGYNLDTYSYWHSTQAGANGQNLSNYKRFQVDSLIEDVRSIFEPERRGVALNEIAEQIKEDIPAIFLYRPVFYYATDGKVDGLSLENVVFPSDRFYNVGSWIFAK